MIVCLGLDVYLLAMCDLTGSRKHSGLPVVVSSFQFNFVMVWRDGCWDSDSLT